MNLPLLFVVLASKKEPKISWQVYAASTAGGLLFVVLAAGLVVLLRRRRRSGAMGANEPLQSEEIEMKPQTAVPQKTKVKWKYSPVGKASKEPPIVV